MLTEFLFSDEWQSHSSVKTLFSMARWNPYVTNWPVVLDALRQLWETGKVSKLETPFFEPFEKPVHK